MRSVTPKYLDHMGAWEQLSEQDVTRFLILDTIFYLLQFGYRATSIARNLHYLKQ